MRFAFFQLFFVFKKGSKIKQNPSFDEVFMQQLEGFCCPYKPTNILEILLILSTFKLSFTLCIEGNDQCCNTHICIYLYLIWNTIISNLVHLFLGSYWVKKQKLSYSFYSCVYRCFFICSGRPVRLTLSFPTFFGGATRFFPNTENREGGLWASLGSSVLCGGFEAQYFAGFILKVHTMVKKEKRKKNKLMSGTPEL